MQGVPPPDIPPVDLLSIIKHWWTVIGGGVAIVGAYWRTSIQLKQAKEEIDELRGDVKEIKHKQDLADVFMARIDERLGHISADLSYLRARADRSKGE